MTDESSAAEAAGRGTLGDERLAEISADSDSGRWEFSYDGGQAVCELLAEVKRLRAVNSRRLRVLKAEADRDAAIARAEKAERAAGIEKARCASAEKLMAEAAKRAEKAEAEVARLRELEAVHLEMTDPFARQRGGLHVSMRAYAEKISEKRNALAQRAEACREVERLRARIAELGELETQHRAISKQLGTIVELDEDDLRRRDEWIEGTLHEARTVYATPWRPVACCVCESADVVYHNYRQQPFCGPCANGDSTRDGSGG